MSDDGEEPLYFVIGPDKRRYGPHSARILQEWRRDRRIGSESHACAAGDTEWRTLRDFPELYTSLPPGFPPSRTKPPPVPLSAAALRDAEIAIPNHLIAAILLTLIGCMPLGMMAMYYSHRVGALVRKGDIDGAWRASRLCRIWCWITFLAGFPASVLLVTALSKWLGLS
jgi:hypothetical protein